MAKSTTRSTADAEFLNDVDVAGNIEVSGGVYLGGTGAANKLDDYEEGTWTPAP